MAEIKAFPALRFTEKAGDIEALTCPPYDIISEEERRAYLERNPRNIIRLELPREGRDPYRQAGNLLEEWMQEGILACDDAPGLYIYEEEFDALGQRMSIKGLCCRVRLEEFSKEVVLPHEETLSKAKTDRYNLMATTGSNFSSIYSLYFDEKNTVYPQIEEASQGEPLLDFRSADGITHRVWKISDPDAIDSIAREFEKKKLYIADGHHRYETALNYRNHMHDAGFNRIGTDQPANFVMMTLVHMEHPGLVVYPTHRIVRDLPAFDGPKLLEDCRAYFDVADTTAEEWEAVMEQHFKAGKKSLVFYDGKLHLLTLKDSSVMEQLLPDGSDAYRQLDVNILHLLILERLLGIDKENMANQKNLIYTRDPAEAIAAVDGGEADCAFLINPTKVEEIAAVAGAGEKMPQKSTYFYPKLITGHLMNKML